MSRRTLRVPRPDAEWAERDRLYLLLVDRAADDARVAAAMASARDALDAYVEAPHGTSASALAVAVAAAVKAFVAAEPLLREGAYPAGRVVTSDGSLLPPTLSKQLAPLGALGALSKNVLGRLLRARVARDEHRVAVALYAELVREDSFTTPVLFKPRPLRELRAAVDAPRRRGRPPGRSPSTREWTDTPEMVEDLVLHLRSAVLTLRRNGATVNVKTVAANLGIDERRLREAFAHHGLNGPALLRQIRREAAEQTR